MLSENYINGEIIDPDNEDLLIRDGKISISAHRHLHIGERKVKRDDTTFAR